MHFLINNACSLKSAVAKISVFVLVLFLVTACNEELQKQQVTVTFNSQAGSAVPDATIDIGKAVAEPTAPTRAGFVFGGWFTDETATPANAYDFEDPVNANLTLYAKWTAITLTVMFDSQGGSAVEDATVEDGQPVAEPTPPTKANSIFKGWFTDKTTTPANAYDFDDPVNANLTLYAKWVDASTVMFDSQGGSAVANVLVEEGQPVAEPTPPTKANSIFKGWFTDKTTTPANAYDFDDPVNTNLTLYAKWANAVTVAFDSQGGSAVADVLVENGQPVAEPNPPTRALFAFDGWFKDKTTTPANAYDFDDPVNANLTLYAKWVDAFNVKLYTDANTLLDTQEVSKFGDRIYAGGPFSVDGQYISDYFTDVAKTMAFDFDNALTTDTTLYVKAKERIKPADKAALIAAINKAIQEDGNSPDLNYINTEDITNMDSVFRGKGSFNGDVSLWDVSKVTSMKEMFNNADQFNADISRWNVGKVTNMKFMFLSAESFNQDISGWKVGSVTNMQGMFTFAYLFNQNISRWDVSSVTNMQNMFNNARAFNQNISTWDVSSVTNMRSMFSLATAFNQNISGWDVSSVTNMSTMFDGASEFNQDLDAWGEHLTKDVNGKFTGSKSNMFRGSKVNPPPTWF